MLLKEKLETKKCMNSTNSEYKMKAFNVNSNIIIIGENLNINHNIIYQIKLALNDIRKNKAGLLGNNTYDEIIFLKNQSPVNYKDIIMFVIADNNEILIMDKDENLLLNIYLNKYTKISTYRNLTNLSIQLLLEFI